MSEQLAVVIARRARRWLLASAVGLSGLCLWGCGSSSGRVSGGEIVASVGGVPITKATYEHWLPIEAVIAWRTIPLEKAPLGVLPEPPSYNECVIWLRSGGAPSGSNSLSVEQRKARCQRLLEELKQKTLEFLITNAWYEGESKEHHLTVTTADVQSDFKRFLHENMPGVGDYEKYLASTGESEADHEFVMRREALWEKTRDEILAQPHLSEVTPALARFTSRWVARTSCQPGYVIPGCRQYHGPLPPP